MRLRLPLFILVLCGSPNTAVRVRVGGLKNWPGIVRFFATSRPTRSGREFSGRVTLLRTNDSGQNAESDGLANGQLPRHVPNICLHLLFLFHNPCKGLATTLKRKPHFANPDNKEIVGARSIKFPVRQSVLHSCRYPSSGSVSETEYRISHSLPMGNRKAQEHQWPRLFPYIFRAHLGCFVAFLVDETFRVRRAALI